MDNVNVLDQMAKIDFNVPINATYTFDDNDNESLESENTRNEKEEEVKTVHSEQPHSPNKKLKIEPLETEETKKSEDSNTSTDVVATNIEEQVADESQVSKTRASKDNVIEPIEKENDIALHCNKNDSSEKSSEKPAIREDSVPVIEIYDDTETVTRRRKAPNPYKTCLENLLLNLSDYLITIMDSYYDLKMNDNVLCNVQQRHARRHSFASVKRHFFDLSYTTMISIIIPQERNENFINMFLNYTVDQANKRPLKWKCEQSHVLHLFQELMAWSKQKKAAMNSSKSVSGNENSCLVGHLNRAPQTMPLSQSQQVVSQNSTLRHPASQVQNNVCLFSSGPPGKEISINISPEALHSFKDNQCNRTVETARHQDFQYGYSPPQTISPVSCSAVSGNPISPPSYYDPHQIIRQGLPTFQTFQHVNQPIPSYRHPEQHNTSINPRLTTNNSLKLPNMHDNRNTSQMHETPQYGTMSASAPFRPVISSVVSLNPYLRQQHHKDRPCICGRATEIKCSKCNIPIYCSYLCQELGSSLHRIECSTTPPS